MVVVPLWWETKRGQGRCWRIGDQRSFGPSPMPALWSPCEGDWGDAPKRAWSPLQSGGSTADARQKGRA